MPLTCAEATTRLNALNLLNTEFEQSLKLASTDASDPAEAKAALEKAKQLKAQLEAGIVELSRELVVKVVVSGALNPYAEALKTAGVPVDHPECAEKKEMTVDLTEIVAAQADRYRAQGLTLWSDDIIQKLETLFDVVSTPEEWRKMEARIEAGMIPIVMPSRSVQLATWRKAFRKLEPEWILGGTKMTLTESYTYDRFSEKMTDPTTDPYDSLFRDIPDRPYLVWTKPTATVEKNGEWKTTDLPYDDENESYDQKRKLAQLHADHPDLCDATDITPLEWVALQSVYTAEVKRRATDNKGDLRRQTITPLDDYNQSYCRFISFGLFSDDNVPQAYFNSDRYLLILERDVVEAPAECGFRPAARS